MRFFFAQKMKENLLQENPGRDYNKTNSIYVKIHRNNKNHGNRGTTMRISLEGTWDVTLADGTAGQMHLPGTLDENGIGHKDTGANQWHPDAALGNAAGETDKDAPIATRFTRRHTYEGEVRISRKIQIPDYGQGRLFVRAERARALRLLVEGEECAVFLPGTLSTPYLFELTGVTPGEHELTFLSDNSYPGMPKEAICYSSAATDETQTNWNGILGEFVMESRPQNFIEALRVYPRQDAENPGRCLCGAGLRREGAT